MLNSAANSRGSARSPGGTNAGMCDASSKTKS
ncbi:H-X9-DG-CTERM domain-containing protein [Rhodococcus qingshengii]